MSGIGFLGAGIILRDGLNIRGLTTAATLWCAAAIGSLAGAGLEEMALIGCLAIIATNILLRPLSRAVNRRVGNGDRELEPSSDDRAVDEFVLEVATTEKSESRVRALVLQAVDRPEYTLRSVRTSSGKASRIEVTSDISTPRGDTAGLERAMQASASTRRSSRASGGARTVNDDGPARRGHTEGADGR